MLDYVGAVNISADKANSTFYNTKNKTMHFYTSGDDFGMTFDYLKFSQIKSLKWTRVSKLVFLYYARRSQ